MDCSLDPYPHLYSDGTNFVKFFGPNDWLNVNMPGSQIAIYSYSEAEVIRGGYKRVPIDTPCQPVLSSPEYKSSFLKS